jgi:NADPH-dependent F420 reductase
MKKISDIMVKEYNIVDKKQLASEIYNIIKTKKIDTTIVVDKNEKPIGIITIWNMIRAKTLGFAFDKTPVEEIMSFPVVTIFEEEKVEDAARMMLRNRIKNVIVIDQNGKILGLITAKQILECEDCFSEDIKKEGLETLHKIAIVGGTGKQGKGLALRWAKVGHEIRIGSRNEESAEKIANEIYNNLRSIGINTKVKFGLNKDVVKDSDIIVLTVPYASLSDLILDIRDSIKPGQIFISPIVPITVDQEGEIGTERTRIAAAEKVSLMTRVLGAKVVAAFHTIPATNLSRIDFPLNFDVVVCGDDENAKQKVMNLVSQIPNLRPLDGGSLRKAVTLEYLTSLAIQIGRTYKKPTIGLKFL